MKQEIYHCLGILKFAWEEGRKSLKIRRFCFYTSVVISLTPATYSIVKGLVGYIGDYIAFSRPEPIFHIPYESIYTQLVHGSFFLWAGIGFIAAAAAALFFLVHYFVKGLSESLVIEASEDICHGRAVSFSPLVLTGLKYWGSIVVMDWVYLVFNFFLIIGAFVAGFVMSGYLEGIFTFIMLIFLLIPLVCIMGMASLTQIFARRFMVLYHLSLIQSIIKAIEFTDKHFTSILVFGGLNGLVYSVGILFYTILGLILPVAAYFIIAMMTNFTFVLQSNSIYGLFVVFTSFSVYISLKGGSALFRTVYEIAATKFFHETYQEKDLIS
jgi:hypothetical protein